MVIIYLKDYHSKVQTFIDNNNFTTLKKDPTKAIHNKVTATIKSCQFILPKNSNKKTH